MLLKRIIMFFLSIFMILMLTNCNSSKSSSGKDIWVGAYEFYEFVPENINMQYNINIYKCEDSLLSEINIDGFQTKARIRAQVVQDGEKIDFVFDDYLPDNEYEIFIKGDLLFSFKRIDNEIYTCWGKLKPINPENEISDKIYFTKND